MKTSLLAYQNTLRTPVFTAFLSFFVLFLAIQSTRAGSATWSSNPPDNLWGDSANWTPPTVPDGMNDTATFTTSAVTTLYTTSEDGPIAISEIDFSPGASAFNITPQGGSGFTFEGAGVINESGITQNFLCEGFPSSVTLTFLNEASAGDLNFFSLPGGTPGDNGFIGFLYFFNSANAGSSSFSLGGGVGRNKNGALGNFYDTSSMRAATLTVAGGSQTGNGAKLNFNNSSTAGQGTLIVNGGTNGSTGGTVFFLDDSNGGRANVTLSGNGTLDLASHSAPGVTIGALQGDGGLVFLGSSTLTVKNSSDVRFGGVISGNGRLEKGAHGNLDLTNGNSYTGSTNVTDGILLVDNTTGSGTGTGPVRVKSGALGGDGTIAGAVTVGTGSGKGAFLSPGKAQDTAVLTLLNSLSFNADGGYRCGLNSDTASSDEVFVSGVKINSGARFLSADAGASVLTPGIVLTVINNTAAIPIVGTFANLSDGSTLVIGSNSYQANYEGGDGNDLTLTVVP
jgi:autotransporter-associated beta strand protein